MIIEFDTTIDWQPVPASFNNNGRIYAAAPHRCLILVVQEGAAEELDFIAGNLHSGDAPRYDCLVGNHDGARFPDFVLPQYTGYQHSKLSVLGSADGEPVDMRLSEMLEGAPVPGENAGVRHRANLEYTSLHLSPALMTRAAELAYRYHGEQSDNLNDFIATAVMEYCLNLE